MKFKCLIFDLDGTLVDTITDIAAAMNRALSSKGFPPQPLDRYTSLVGWGMRRLAFLALPEDGREDRVADEVSAAAIRFYEETPVEHSKPYPGIPELIASLRNMKIKTAVLTNKPDPVAQLVVSRLFPPGSFDVVSGERPGIPRKPDPAEAWEIMMTLDANPRTTIMIGDSEIDIETARAADCSSVGVSWGFRSRDVLEKAGAGRIIDSPEEILTLVRDTKL